MKLPYWLLKLLPMWDYICPRCRREVAKNSYKCPYCGEQFGVPVSVPPSVLKDKEALEDYVHKYIFPKVSQAQREYLAQFFTVLFNDGFESGNFSAWTGSRLVTVDSALAHHGTYSAKAAGAPGVSYYCYKDITAINEGYHRIYFYFSGYTPPYNGCFIEIPRMFANDETNLVGFSIYNNIGTLEWRLSARLDNATYTYNSSTSPPIQLDTWYCIEVYWKRSSGANDGEAKLYINGTLYITLSGLDNDSLAANRIYEWYYQDNGWGYVIPARIDCVVVADTYIGTEATAVTVTVTDGVSLSDAVLRNKMLTVSDSVGLADATLKNWTPIVTDTVSILESVLRNKAFSVLDSVGLADAIYRGKQFAVTDAVTLTDVIDVIKGLLLKTVMDSVGLSDAVLRDKAFSVADSIGLSDTILRGKVLAVLDQLRLADFVQAHKQLLVADEVLLADLARAVLKLVLVGEAVSLADNVVVVGGRLVWRLRIVGESFEALRVEGESFYPLNVRGEDLELLRVEGEDL